MASMLENTGPMHVKDQCAQARSFFCVRMLVTEVGIAIGVAFACNAAACVLS